MDQKGFPGQMEWLSYLYAFPSSRLSCYSGSRTKWFSGNRKYDTFFTRPLWRKGGSSRFQFENAPIMMKHLGPVTCYVGRIITIIKPRKPNDQGNSYKTISLLSPIAKLLKNPPYHHKTIHCQLTARSTKNSSRTLTTGAYWHLITASHIWGSGTSDLLPVTS